MIRDVTLKAGTGPLIALFCVHDATGAASPADSPPSVVLITEDNGGAVTEAQLGVTVTSIDTGVYKVTVDVDTVISNAHHISIFWGYCSYAIDGVTQNTPITPFRFVPGRDGGKVVTDGSNTASTFKVSASGAGLLLTTQTDDASNALIVFMTGNLAGQVRKISAYNTSTAFLTVSSAFTGAPANNDAFILINF